jgi:uncharacterized protein (DUF2249 family)
MSNDTVTLDVREDIRSGREPFSKIMAAVAGLKATQDLRLIAPFEPVPLFGILSQQGFSHRSSPTSAGDFEVVFFRTPAGTMSADLKVKGGSIPAAAGHAVCSGAPVIEVDARGLEPPQPLVKILESLTNLPQGARLLARTDRRPMHLYAQIEERGFKGESEEQADGSFVTYVEHR